MKKTAFVFPGQGSQYPGMGRDLYGNFDTVKRIFEEASDALGLDLKEICFNGSQEALSKTENTQPAILTVSYAAFRVLLDETGIVPGFLAGHSLGEITALTASGAVSFTDAIRIVRERGRFMKDAGMNREGVMAAVSGAGPQPVRDACLAAAKTGNYVGVACYNSPEQIVIAGSKDSVEQACQILESQNRAKCVFIKVGGAFHTPHMEPAALKLKIILDGCVFGGFKWPVVSNVTALPYAGTAEIPGILTKQMTVPVQWQAVMEYLASHGTDIVIEAGPQKVLKNFAQKSGLGITPYSFEKKDDAEAICSMLNSDGRHAAKFKKPGDGVVMCLTAALCAKNTNWDEEQYKKGVIEPCRRIRVLSEITAKTTGEANAGMLKEAVDLLKIVLETKKVSRTEQIEILSEITGT